MKLILSVWKWIHRTKFNALNNVYGSTKQECALILLDSASDNCDDIVNKSCMWAKHFFLTPMYYCLVANRFFSCETQIYFYRLYFSAPKTIWDTERKRVFVVSECMCILFDTKEARRTVITQPVNVNGSIQVGSTVRLPFENVEFSIRKVARMFEFAVSQIETYGISVNRLLLWW